MEGRTVQGRVGRRQGSSLGAAGQHKVGGRGAATATRARCPQPADGNIGTRTSSTRSNSTAGLPHRCSQALLAVGVRAACGDVLHQVVQRAAQKQRHALRRQGGRLSQAGTAGSEHRRGQGSRLWQMFTSRALYCPAVPLQCRSTCDAAPGAAAAR